MRLSGKCTHLLNSASEIGADLHTLSHRLHSSTLEAWGSFRESVLYARNSPSNREFKLIFSPTTFLVPFVPMWLCVYSASSRKDFAISRKHSGAAKAQVRLRRASDKLFVSVRDEGIGFDVRELGKKEGLGIRSMKERVYLLGGRFEIHSEPGKGTRIEAWVALQPKSELATR